MSTVPSNEAIQATLDLAKERRRKGWRFFWIALGLFVALLALSPLIAYLTWQAHGKGLLRKQIAAISSGEPLTTREMTLAQAVPADQPDISGLWLAATLPFDGPAFEKACGDLPIVGTGATIAPSDPWPNTGAVEGFLRQYESQLAALHTAARTPGVVRFPRQFNRGIGLLLPDVQRMRGASRALMLQMHQQLKHGEIDAALESLRTQFALANTLEHDPILISMLVRMSITAQAMQQVLVIAQSQTLTDAQLAELQQLVRGSDLQPQFKRAFFGERAMAFHTFYLPMGMLSVNLDQVQNAEFETDRDAAGVKRPADCAKALEIYARMIAASERPFPELFDEFETIDDEIKALAAENVSLARFQYTLTLQLIPAIHAITQATGRSRAMRDTTDCILAAKRFELKHGRLPTALSELVPDFLAQVPIDPFDGQPLRFQTIGRDLVVYSIGEDRVDNQGETDDSQTRPDIVARMKFGKD